MISRLKRLFTMQYAYTQVTDQLRARGLLTMALLLAVGALPWLVFTLKPPLELSRGQNLGGAVTPLALLLLAAGMYIAVQSGRVELSAWMLTLTLLMLTGFVTLLSGPVLTTNTIMSLTLPILVAGVLLDRRALLGVSCVVLALVVIAALAQSQNPGVLELALADRAVIDLIIVSLNLLFVIGLLAFFGVGLRAIATDTLRNLRQRQLAAGILAMLGQSSVEEAEVLTRALSEARAHFGYSYAQIYLMDEAGSRLFRASAPAERQEAAGSLSLTENSAISEAARSRQAVMVSADDSLGRGGHLLASSQFGLAVPLQHAGLLLGVLDVQRGQAQPFSAADIETAYFFAGQVAAVLQQIRQTNELRSNLEEQEAVSARLQTQLVEYQQRERRSVAGSWGAYLQGRGRSALGFDLEPGHKLTAASDLPEALRPALERGEIVVENREDGEQVVQVPIVFRDQILGAMAFHVPRGRGVSSRQLEMARVVSERLALALENIRLFEQSQAQAQREAKAGQIAAQLIGATDVRAVLNIAAAQFNEALGAVHTRIFLEPEAFEEQRREETVS